MAAGRAGPARTSLKYSLAWWRTVSLSFMALQMVPISLKAEIRVRSVDTSVRACTGGRHDRHVGHSGSDSAGARGRQVRRHSWSRADLSHGAAQQGQDSAAASVGSTAKARGTAARRCHQQLCRPQASTHSICCFKLGLLRHA